MEDADLYLMRDGTYAEQGMCSKGDDGVLRHNENGVPVAIDSEGKPETLSRVVENGNVAAAAGVTSAPEAMPMMVGTLDEAMAAAEEHHADADAEPVAPEEPADGAGVAASAEEPAKEAEGGVAGAGAAVPAEEPAKPAEPVAPDTAPAPEPDHAARRARK
jgi:hypothetical protein